MLPGNAQYEGHGCALAHRSENGQAKDQRRWPLDNDVPPPAPVPTCSTPSTPSTTSTLVPLVPLVAPVPRVPKVILARSRTRPGSTLTLLQVWFGYRERALMGVEG